MTFQQKRQDNDIQIEDGDNLNLRPEQRSFKYLIMYQYMKCCIEGSKEMTKGGLVKRTINGEEVIVDVVANRIEVFINSVDMLKTFLLPSLKLAKDRRKFEPQLLKVRAELDSAKIERDKRNNKIAHYWRQLSNKKNPETELTQQEQYLGEVKKYKARVEEAYTEKKLQIYKKRLLPILCNIMAAKNYFDEYNTY